jgi:hypothetical protein
MLPLFAPLYGKLHDGILAKLLQPVVIILWAFFSLYAAVRINEIA